MMHNTNHINNVHVLIAENKHVVKENRKKLKEAVKNEKLAKQEAIKNEKLAKREAAKNEKLAKQEAIKNEKLAKREAIKNEKLAKQEAVKNEKLAKREAIKNEKMAKQEVYNHTYCENKLKDINNMLSQTNSSSNTLKPIQIDFEDERNKRHDNTIFNTYTCLINHKINELPKYINKKKWETYKKKYNYTDDKIFNECDKSNMLARIISEYISKITSRQCIKDEQIQLAICNNMCKKLQNGIYINKPNTSLRPTKNGQIVSEEKKTNLCLKSFDAQITGNLNGFVCAKICYGSGGHQDNVFEEMDTVCEWWKKYKFNTNKILVILIDTDLKKKKLNLTKKYIDINNIKIFNHVEFQQYLIDIN